MTPPDLKALEKIHAKLNRKLAAWEKKKLAELLKSFRDAEVEIKALLVSAEGWEKTRLESLLVEVDRAIDRMQHNAEMWVRGRTDVLPESPLAGLAQFPALTGGEAAIAATGVNASFSIVHMPVMSYMQDYQLGLIRRITQDVREQIKDELKRGYIMGESIPDIAKRLRNTKLDKGVWPSVEKRAEVVARTEIIRASNQGALYAYRQYDIKRVMWLAAADERTCPVCGALHRKIFPIDQVPFGGPPAHPRCLPGDTRVSASDISAASKRWYDGNLVVINTTSGKELSCTPNHPILTPGGWVAAGLLNKGGYVISSSGSEWVTARVNSDNKNMPSRIEDIAKSFGSSQEVAAMPVPISPEDFHGDGKGSKIAIIWANRLLRDCFNTSGDEHGSQFSLGIRNMELFRLNGLGAKAFLFKGMDMELRRSIGSFNQTHSFVLTSSGHSDQHGFAAISGLDFVFKQTAPNDTPVNTIPFSKGLFGFTSKIECNHFFGGDIDTTTKAFNRGYASHFYPSLFNSLGNSPIGDTKLFSQTNSGAPGKVFVDDIVDIKIEPFHGYVYNLQTKDGFYTANGIITHNCRCYITPHIIATEEEGKQADLEAKKNVKDFKD